jgi:acetylornithine deacetylase/succinyl-diaminopimelate desuccinylase-like protein
MHPAVQLLRELIALPSVNPAFLAHNHPFAGEQRVAGFIAATAAQAGLDIEVQEVLPQRSNVLARLTPPGPVHQRVVLAPHMDTVGGDDPSLFQPRIANGRVHGRGACDTKGSVACMLTALESLARSSHRPRHTEITLAALVDEENAQLGSRFLAESAIKADLAIVGEPTQLRVVTAHKGDVWLRLLTRGKAAHGARPDLGRNAVHLMARVVHLLETRYASELRRRLRHSILGRGTINVGVIAGGSQPNIVPDRCTIDIDRRTLPGENERTVRKEIRALLARHKLQVAFASIRGGPCPALQTDVRLPLVRSFLANARQTRPLGVDYFCDAAVLAQGNIPSIVFGPGDIAQAHTADEWITLRHLEHGTALLLKFLQSLP